MKKTLEDILMNNIYLTEEQLLQVVPQLKKLKEFKNGKVLKHTILAIRNSKLDLELRLALLFHDIAKPIVFCKINGEDSYPKHQVVGEKIARKFLCNYPFKSKVDLETVYTLIREHMNKKDKTSTDKAITRLYNRTGKAFPKLLELFKADVMGYENYNLLLVEKVEQKIKEWEEKDRTVFKPSEYYAVNGYDLLKLGFKGKELGKILLYLQSLVDNNKVENKKEILLSKIQNYLDNMNE